MQLAMSLATMHTDSFRHLEWPRIFYLYLQVLVYCSPIPQSLGLPIHCHWLHFWTPLMFQVQMLISTLRLNSVRWYSWIDPNSPPNSWPRYFQRQRPGSSQWSRHMWPWRKSRMQLRWEKWAVMVVSPSSEPAKWINLRLSIEKMTTFSVSNRMSCFNWWTHRSLQRLPTELSHNIYRLAISMCGKSKLDNMKMSKFIVKNQEIKQHFKLHQRRKFVVSSGHWSVQQKIQPKLEETGRWIHAL